MIITVILSNTVMFSVIVLDCYFNIGRYLNFCSKLGGSNFMKFFRILCQSHETEVLFSKRLFYVSFKVKIKTIGISIKYIYNSTFKKKVNY